MRDLGYVLAARATALSVDLAKRGYAVYSGDSLEASIARALQQYFVLKMDLSAGSGPIKTTLTKVTFQPLVSSPQIPAYVTRRVAQVGVIVAELTGGLVLDLKNSTIEEMEIEIDVIHSLSPTVHALACIVHALHCSTLRALIGTRAGVHPRNQLAFRRCDTDAL